MIINSENTVLEERQKQRVRRIVEELGLTCERCGAGDFEVGEALEMGRLWYNEEHGVYMVALGCRNCGNSTGIKLRDFQFLRDEEGRESDPTRMPTANAITGAQGIFLHELAKMYDAEHRFLVG